MVGAPALGRVNHERTLQPQPEPQQVVMHRAHRQQRRDVGGAGTEAHALAVSAEAIGEHQDLTTTAHGSFGLEAQPLNRLLEARGAGRHRYQGGQGGQRQAMGAQGRQLGFVEHRRLQMQHGSTSGIGAQGRAAAAQMHLQAHHQLFAQRINRRIGDLGEALLEVVVQQVRLA